MANGELCTVHNRESHCSACVLQAEKDWRSKRKFAVRVGNLELGSCDKHLSYDDEQDRAEISQWAPDNSHRWVIAVFRPHKEGFDLSFISERPLAKTVSWRDFKKLVRMGYKLLRK